MLSVSLKTWSSRALYSSWFCRTGVESRAFRSAVMMGPALGRAARANARAAGLNKEAGIVLFANGSRTKPPPSAARVEKGL